MKSVLSHTERRRQLRELRTSIIPLRKQCRLRHCTSQTPLHGGVLSTKTRHERENTLSYSYFSSLLFHNRRTDCSLSLLTLMITWEKKEVPQVLLTGDHAKIKDWRLAQSEDITRRRRPDLWKKYKKDK